MEAPTLAAAGTASSLANRLYWDSDRSVGRIAREVDVARGALFGMIRPLPSGLPCPECVSELVYANRTARDDGLLACPGCGLVEEELLIREAWRETALASPSGSVVVDSPPARRLPWIPDGEAPPWTGRGLLGVLMVGAAAGLLLALWTVRR